MRILKIAFVIFIKKPQAHSQFFTLLHANHLLPDIEIFSLLNFSKTFFNHPIILQSNPTPSTYHRQIDMSMQNNQNVQKFYEEVFEDFKNRLFIAYRFKSTISSEQIDKFSKIVKQKLHRKRELFETGIRLSLEKRTPECKTLPILSNPSKVKVEHQQEEANYYRSSVKEPIVERQHEQDESSSSDDDSDDDDLKEFNKPKLPQPEVKKEEPQEKQQPLNENDSEELYEEEDRKKEEILSKSEKKICAHIIASYGTKNKKHIPKVEKTKIDLENVFIRTGDRELFYTKISCDLEQAAYNNIKL